MLEIDKIADKVVDALRGRAKEEGFEISIGEQPAHLKKKFSFAKYFIFAILSFLIGIGAYILFKRTLLLPSYVTYARVVAMNIVPLMILIGTGRAFKHSKWSKDK